MGNSKQLTTELEEKIILKYNEGLSYAEIGYICEFQKKTKHILQ